MKRTMMIGILCAAAMAWAGSGFGAILSLRGQSRNSQGLPNLSFVAGESVTLWAQAQRDRADQDIEFHFVVSLGGQVVLSQGGNRFSGPGLTGGAQIQNLRFFTRPGRYDWEVRALSGDTAVTTAGQFVMVAPQAVQNTLRLDLVSPRDNEKFPAAEGLVMAWTCQGNRQFRVTVGEDDSFHNPNWVRTTTEKQIVYRADPGSPLEALQPGREYRWKVEIMEGSQVLAVSERIGRFSLEASRTEPPKAPETPAPPASDIPELELVSPGDGEELWPPYRFSWKGVEE